MTENKKIKFIDLDIDLDLDKLKHVASQIEPIESKTVTFLVTRPWWKDHHARLQTCLGLLVSGSHVVAPNYDDDEIVIENMFKNGATITIIDQDTKNYKLLEMESSSCHDNAILLLAAGKVDQVKSGFALSKDGRWRFHSWCVKDCVKDSVKDSVKDKKIIETTEPRLIYLTSV